MENGQNVLSQALGRICIPSPFPMPDFGPIVLRAVDLAVGETLHRLEVGEVALGIPIGRVAVLEIDERSALRDPGIVGQ